MIQKKILCVTLTILMILSSFTALARENMANVLATVKSKIEIPAELSVFDSSTNTRNDKTTYRFNWYTEDGAKALSVTATGDGIITNYYYHSDDMYISGDKRLSSVTKADVQAYAENFLKKILPEGFNETSKFVLKSSDSYLSDFGTEYTFYFSRKVNGIPVINQHASIQTLVKDDAITVTNYSSNFDKDIVFEAPAETYIENKEEAFKTAFPAELLYVKKDYKSEEFSLIYRVDNGYISAYTGEKEELFTNAELYLEKNESALMDYYEGNLGSGFTPEEITEIENVSGLISVDDAVKLLKSDTALDISKDSKVTSSHYFKNDKKYTLEISLETDENSGERITLDAQTKELKSFHSYRYSEDRKSEDKLSDKEKAQAEKLIDQTVKKYAGDYLLKEGELTAESKYATKSFTRLENNIPVEGNNIYVTYYGGKITSYSKNFEDKTFASPEGIISADEAYTKILEHYPIQLCYMNTGEKYQLCYSLDAENITPELNAKTGEKFRDNNSEQTAVYKDIENHWCKTAVEKLQETGIYFEGESFKPEKEITQLEMLRLFAASVIYTSYLDMDTEDLYKNLERANIIKSDERADNSPVLREDAFVYLIRFLGCEKIAKAEEIFTTKFADQDLISEGKLGYAAILSGLKVINGNGGFVKPKDNLTRAEAFVMIYNLLTNNS